MYRKDVLTFAYECCKANGSAAGVDNQTFEDIEAIGRRSGYMRRFVLGWKKLGHEKRLGACIVNYADDMVICFRGRAEGALTTMRVMMTKLKLTRQ